MSSSYYRVIPEPVSYRMYGFDNVTAKQMHAITRRLQKPTYNTDFSYKQCFQAEASPPRPPPVTCKHARAPKTDQTEPSFGTHKDLERAIRRICTPTLSRMAAEGKIAPTYEANFEQQLKNTEIRTGTEQSKAMQRISRPTTASKSKTTETEKEYVTIDYSDDQPVTSGNIQSILDRVCTPTIASEGGSGPTCPKRRDSVGKRGLVKQMPLISGLERSKNVTEIVNRLYTTPDSPSMNYRFKYNMPKLGVQRPQSSVIRRPPSGISRKSTLSSLSQPAPNFAIYITKKNSNNLRETAWNDPEHFKAKGISLESVKSEEKSEIISDQE